MNPSEADGREPQQRDVGITLSGGGNRATVFGLGALLAISDAGLRERVLSIGSVSGGSIANGAVMVGPDFGTADATAIEEHFAKLVRSIADRGMLQGGAPATRGYLRAVILSLVTVVAGVIVTLVAMLARWWIVLGVALAVTVIAAFVLARLFLKRSEVTERAIDTELLGDERTTLAEQHARDLSVHHVMCTSELQVGTTFYFSNRLVYGWEFGGNAAAVDVPLATAVQASACVPGAFRARAIALSDLGLESSKTDQIVIVDGGVYDNMADEWEYGFPGRSKSWPSVRDSQPRGASLLVVVNASAGWRQLKSIPKRGVGFELAGVLRSKDIQYDVSTAHRRRALFSEFERWPSGGRFGGLFVQIDDNPYRLLRMVKSQPDDFVTADAPDRARWAGEAENFLDAVGISEQAWDDITAASAGVATTLKPLGADVCAGLLEHAYMLTMANLHVLFGLGAVQEPVDRARFRRIAGASG